jgi:hypothetical protein
VEAGRHTRTCEVPGGGAASVTLEPGAGFQHYDSFLYPMQFTSKVPVRVFVRIALEVDRRPRP